MLSEFSRSRWKRITNQLFLQSEDNNRSDHVLYLSQNFWGGVNCRNNCPNRLCDIHSGDLLVLPTVKLESVNDVSLRGLAALRDDLCD